MVTFCDGVGAADGAASAEAGWVAVGGDEVVVSGEDAEGVAAEGSEAAEMEGKEEPSGMGMGRKSGFEVLRLGAVVASGASGAEAGAGSSAHTGKAREASKSRKKYFLGNIKKGLLRFQRTETHDDGHGHVIGRRFL